MELLETEIQGRLSNETDEYRRLAEQHREYELRLQHIATRRPFTQRDWFEESVVKKRKLLVRDRLQAMTQLPVEVA